MDIKSYLWVLIFVFGVTSTCSGTVSKGVTRSLFNVNQTSDVITTIHQNHNIVESRNYENHKEEDSSFLNRVGWPSFRTFERLRRVSGGEKVLYNSDEVGKSLDSRQFLTSNAEHGDQEDSSSRKSILNIWLTLLIAAVAAAIFS